MGMQMRLRVIWKVKGTSRKLEVSKLEVSSLEDSNDDIICTIQFDVYILIFFMCFVLINHLE